MKKFNNKQMKEYGKMKRVLVSACSIVAFIAISAMLYAGSIGYNPRVVYVNDNSTIIMGAVYGDNATAWSASRVYAVGKYIKVYKNNAAQMFYCSVAGTGATNTPTWTYAGVDVTDGTATLSYVYPTRNKYRITNLSTAECYVAYGNTAVVGKGIYLAPKGSDGYFIEGNYQGEIQVVPNSGASVTSSIAIHVE